VKKFLGARKKAKKEKKGQPLGTPNFYFKKKGQPLGTPNFYFMYTRILVCKGVYTNKIGVRPQCTPKSRCT
jgi:hypothetical protein